jgi:ferredoxin-type protein NapH
VQVAVALFYLALPFAGLERVAGTLGALRLGPVDLVEPAGALSAALAARAVPWALVLGALPVALSALLLGSVLCSWGCPFGLVSELADGLRRRRWAARPWEAARAPRAAALLGALAASAILSAPVAALLSPPRLATALPLEALCARAVPWVTAALLLAFLAIDLLGPRRIVCRALCPAGALQAWLRAPFTWRPRFEASRCRCPGVPPCQAACPWGLDPRPGGMGPRDGCTSCLACVERCPSAALSLRHRAAGPGAAGGARPAT